MSELPLDLETWDRAKLLERWQHYFDRLPPPHTHASFMRLAIAFQIQAGGNGKLRGPGLTRKRPSAQPSFNPLSPGTHLVREWQGTTYHVTVTEAGFDFGDKTYRSLSAIARMITGTAWSGPAFFGVKA